MKLNRIPLLSDADLTGKEGYFVVASSGKAALSTAATDVPLGVVAIGDVDDADNSIALAGVGNVEKVKLSGTVALGARLMLSTDGTVVTEAGTAAHTVVAVALEDGVSTELINAVIITPIKVAATT